MYKPIAERETETERKTGETDIENKRAEKGDRNWGI